MKTQLSSIDIRILSDEFRKRLVSARIDKVYQISKRELKVRFHIPGKGSVELIVAPNFVSMTRYGRKAPKDATSFAMQLRKHLSGGFVRDVRQHNFDRILEFGVENRGKEYTLIVELFSRGNVILLDSERKILGLLEWQKWRHRRLGVRQVYEYPPEGVNSPALEEEEFTRILSGSERGIAATLAKELSLGGLYAEELCLMAGVERDKVSSGLSEDEGKALFGAMKGLFEEELKPAIVLDGEGMVDVVPFGLEGYKGFGQKAFESFNGAIDEYFSKQEFSEKEDIAEGRFEGKLKQLQEMREKQEKSLVELEENSREYKRIGDIIYQNLQDVERVIELARKRELSAGDKVGRVVAEKMNKDGTVKVEINEI